jgi:hypothetical protein
MFGDPAVLYRSAVDDESFTELTMSLSRSEWGL